jgi:hypothetical protein
MKGWPQFPDRVSPESTGVMSMCCRARTNRFIPGALAVCLLFVDSCDSGGLQPQGALQPQRGLTAAEAKGALVELLRRDPTAFQRKFNPDDLAKQPVTSQVAGSYRCGEFSIHLTEARYQITVQYGCIFEYHGSFQFRGGRWLASQPYWTSTGLVRKLASP